MIMFCFYTTWNFSWLTLRVLSPEKIQRVLSKGDKALYISLLNTAVFGSFMAYIYPRNVKVKIKGKIYYFQFGLKMVIIDFLTHQLPLIIGTYKHLYNTGSPLYLVPFIGSYRYYLYKFHDNKPPYKIPERLAYIIPIGCGLLDIWLRKKEIKLL